MTIQKFKLNESGRPKPPKPLLWDDLVAFIKSQNLSDDVQVKIINKARSVPPGTWPHFIKNINVHIANISKVSKNETKQE